MWRGPVGHYQVPVFSSELQLARLILYLYLLPESVGCFANVSRSTEDVRRPIRLCIWYKHDFEGMMSPVCISCVRNLGVFGYHDVFVMS